MKLKKYSLVILSISLILLVFVSSASAADTNKTDVISIDESANLENNLLSIDNNVENNELDNNTLKVSNDEVLTAGNNNLYVNGSMVSGGDGKSEETAFNTLAEAIGESGDNDIIMIASGVYTGTENIDLVIKKPLNFKKYGDSEAIFDAQGLSRIWTVTASSINITGLTFKNGKADNGGAIYFGSDISNSNINASFINNTANGYHTSDGGGANYFVGSVSGSNIGGLYTNNAAGSGGANYFWASVSGSNIGGLYTNNTALLWGGANYFSGSVSDSNVSGTYSNNTAEIYGGANYFENSVSGSNIIGTYSNNKAEYYGGANYFSGSVSGSNVSGEYISNTAEIYGGGANYFLKSVSGSNITGTFTNNAAWSGGANYFENSVSGSNITGTYSNNTAANGDGGANYFKSVSDSNVGGTYINNTAKYYGGANYFNSDIPGSNVFGTYANNTAAWSGGANYFNGGFSGLNVTGVYINNTASNAIIHFEDYNNEGFDADITNAIFLNNNCTYEIYARTQVVVVKDSWFGNNASNYMNEPNINDKVTIDNWLFLNATADNASLLVLDSSNITFKLYSTDGTNVSDFDNSKLPVVNLTLAATNGDVDKTTTLDNIVKYVATEQGKGSVTASIENAEYTIFLDNIGLNPEFSAKVIPQEIDYGENSTIFLSYNNTATGTVNITLKSKNYYKTVVMDINQTITIADLPVGEYDVAVEYSGDEIFEGAAANATLIVNKLDPGLSVDAPTVSYGEDIVLYLDYNDTATGTADIAVAGPGGHIFALNQTLNKTLTFDNTLKPGNYIVSVYYHGDEIFNETNIMDVNLTISKLDPELSVEAPTVTYGDDIVLYLDYNDTATGTADIAVAGPGGHIFALNQTLNKTLTFDNTLKPGNYIVSVYYHGDEIFNETNIMDVNLTISKLDPELSVEAPTVTYGDDIVLYLDYNDTATGTADIAVAGPGGHIFALNQTLNKTFTFDNTLKPGNYVVSVYYHGDEIFNETNIMDVNLTISKLDPELSVEAPTVTYGDDIVLYLDYNDTATGTADIAVAGPGGHIFALNQTLNKTFTFDNTLKPGNYVVSVYYHGDEIFNETNIMDVNLTIDKIDSGLSVESLITPYVEDLFIGLNFNESATGLVNITLVGEYYIYSFEDIALNSSVLLPDYIYPDSYNVTVSYSGDEVFEGATANATLIVISLNPELSVDDSIIDYGDKIILVLHYNSNATGRANIFFRGEKYGGDAWNEPLNNTIIIEFSLLPDRYNVTVEYFGNRIFEGASVNATLIVNKLDSGLSVDAPSVSYGEDIVLYLDYNDTATGTADIAIAGPGGHIFALNQTLNKTLTFDNTLKPGKYIVSVYYHGDDIFNETNIMDVNLTINKLDSDLAVDSLTTPFTESISISLNFNDTATGKVNITLVGENYNYSFEDIALKSSILLPEVIYPDSYNVTVSYGGDEIFEDATANATLIITKLSPELSVEDSVIDYGDKIILVLHYNTNATGRANIFFRGEKYGGDAWNEPLNNTIIIEFSLLPDRYNVTVEYFGNRIFEGASVNATLIVNKLDPGLSVDAPTVSYGEDIVLNLDYNDTATGTADITIAGPGGYILDLNQTLNKTLTFDNTLKPGNYIVSLYYHGDEIFNETNMDVNLTIDRVDITPEITLNDTVLTVSVPEDAIGNITLTVGNETLTSPIEDGTAIFDLSNIPAGDYNATLAYPGDDKYAGFDVAYPVSIEDEYVLTAEDLVKYYGGPERFVVNLTDGKGRPVANAIVTINIKDKKYDRTTDENGQAFMAVNLNSGEYPVVVTYNDTSVNATVTVLSTVNGTDLVKVFRNATQFYATFLDSQGNYLAKGTVITFNINGVFYNRTVEDKGLAKLNINLNQGKYIITLINTVTGENTANNITVIPRIIENSDITKYFRNGTQYTVKVIGDDGKAVGAGEIVTFNINGVLYNRTTNESGIAKLNINLHPGDYIITAEYKGCVVSNNIKVLPVLNATDISMKYRDGTQFKATLVDGQGKPYVGQSVTFNVNGVFYNRPTDSTGTAKLNINLMPGEYIITSSYNGSSIANKITIKG